MKTPRFGLSIAVLLAVAVQAAPPTGGTGPGGIGTTDGASSLEVWYDATTLDQTEGSGVALWRDGSGNTRNAIQNTAGYQPEFRTNVLNGRPVLRFPSSPDNYFNTITLQSSDSGITEFHVLNAINSTSYKFILEVNGGGDPMFFVFGDGYQFFTSGYVSCLGAGDWDIMSLLSRTSAPAGKWIYEDGAMRVTNGVATAVPASGTYTLFCRNSNSLYYEGDYAEMIVHGRCLNGAERTIVENYLSAKWATSLAAGDVYAGDDNAKGDYDQDVFGIGRSNATEQVTSAGQNGLGLEATGGTLDTDSEWVLAGHRSAANGPVAQDLPAGVSQRWARVWYVDKSGSVDVDMAFGYDATGQVAPGAGAKFFLLYSAGQAPFNFATQAVSYVRSGNTVTFSVPDAGLSDGYYTIGADEALPTVPTAVTGGGPGGIGTTDGASSLELWLDATTLTLADGAAVSSWSDRSGNGRTAIQADTRYQPTFSNNAQNSRGVVRCLTSSNAMGGVSFDTSDGGLSVLMALKATALGGYHCVWERASSGPNTWISGGNGYEIGGGGGGSIIGGLAGDWDITSVRYGTNATTRRWFHEDGRQVVTSAAGITVYGGAFTLFNRALADGLRGEVGEFILHGRTINDTERTIIENYLSAKWATALDVAGGALDVYEGDTPAKGDHDYDVCGIGNLGGQKVMSGGAAGFGMAERGINDVLSPGEWILAGHNGAPAASVPGDRGWGRVWYVDVTGGADAVLTFDASDAGTTISSGEYRLLYRAASANPWTVLQVASALSGDRVSFTLTAAQMQDGYYTLEVIPFGTLIIIR